MNMEREARLEYPFLLTPPLTEEEAYDLLQEERFCITPEDLNEPEEYEPFDPEIDFMPTRR